jgi:hypothetical protein
MSDTNLLDWIEGVGAQLWKDRHSHNWTCQVITKGQVIQPTRATVRAAITDAKADYDEQMKGNNNEQRSTVTNGPIAKGA